MNSGLSKIKNFTGGVGGCSSGHGSPTLLVKTARKVHTLHHFFHCMSQADTHTKASPTTTCLRIYSKYIQLLFTKGQSEDHGLQLSFLNVSLNFGGIDGPNMSSEATIDNFLFKNVWSVSTCNVRAAHISN